MPNQLIHESSPYLLQHAHNPVNWYPWGREALEMAKQQNKLILVSIGYAACHWCHVMEHECFEDEEVADLMNAHFVNIKVDREERPDIDKIYMDAVMIMRQQGGWPLNVIALPDKRPIFGGTYFPKENWKQVLLQVVQLYREQPQRAIEYADNLEAAIKGVGKVTPVSQPTDFSLQEVKQMADGWLERLDLKWGGRKSSRNKFPLPMNNGLLLRLAHYLQHEPLQQAVDVTLDKMAFGGIYDHLGGGFARYAVDPYWKVPHFEKMLYDNAQLVSLYAEAYQKNPLPRYKRVVYQTLEFINREMCAPGGGFYSALDADSEGKEGKYYVWQYEEIEQLLGEDAKLFADYYNAHPMGNWEQTNVLFVLETEEDFAERWKLDVASFKAKMEACRARLFEARQQRTRPATDDKILTSWNALMLKGYVDAYRVFGEAAFLEKAVETARFLSDQMTEEGGRLYRNYKNGKRSIPAFLDDYAFFIQACIALYEVTFDEQWLEQAMKHTTYVWNHFSDEESGLFFYTSDEEEVLITRKIELQDDVIPASNSAMAHNLFLLGLLYHRQDFRDRSRQMLLNLKADILKGPDWYACWGQLMLKQVFPHYEVAITGPEALNLRMQFEQHYHPHRLFAGAETGSNLPILQHRFGEQTTIYVCREYSCQLPVHTVEEALEQMK